MLAGNYGGEPPRTILPVARDTKNQFQILREQSAAPREERIRAATQEDLSATPAIKWLGIRIESPVADHAGAEDLRRRDAAAKGLRREIARAEERMRATAAEKNFASGITAGVYTVEDIPRSMDAQKVLDLAEYYMAERAIGLDMIRERK